MSDYLSPNLRVIKQRWPQLAVQLGSCQMAELEVLPTAEGRSVSYRGVKLHSSYRPQTEAQRWLQATLLPRCDAAVFLGMGLAYQVEEFVRQRPAAPLLLVELDLALLLALLAQRDLTVLLGREELQLCVHADQFERELLRLQGRRPQLWQLPAWEKLGAELYRPLGQSLLHFVRQDNLQQNTQQRFEALWRRNITSNFLYFSQASDAAALFSRLAGQPALLLAAGPSLRCYLPQLAELQRRMLLLCVDTVLPLLWPLGVAPDLVFTADPQLANALHLQPHGCATAYLVADPASQPSALRLPWRHLLLSASPIPLMQDLQRHFGWPRTMLRSGGTVASFAWDWAQRCQLTPLVLLGYDFSFSGDTSHCAGTMGALHRWALAQRWAPLEQREWAAVNNAETVAVAQGGKTWRSSRQLRIYAQWMEDQCRHCAPAPSQLLGEGWLQSPQLAATQASSVDQLLRLPVRRAQLDKLLRHPPPADGPAAPQLHAWINS